MESTSGLGFWMFGGSQVWSFWGVPQVWGLGCLGVPRFGVLGVSLGFGVFGGSWVWGFRVFPPRFGVLGSPQVWGSGVLPCWFLGSGGPCPPRCPPIPPLSQPERIDPPDPTKPDYDIRADVWSLGISLVSHCPHTGPRLSPGVTKLAPTHPSVPSCHRTVTKLGPNWSQPIPVFPTATKLPPNCHQMAPA